MNETIHYTHCPVCQATAIHRELLAKDYTVSGEEFEIWHCDQCTARFTQDVPVQSAIGRYYQSAEYISHTNTNKGLVNRLYHWVRHRALQQKRQLIMSATQRQQGHLLDVGAGVGAFAAYMKEKGWEVTALEPDADTRQRAALQYGLELKPAEQLFEPAAGCYDAITLWHVLEHVHQLQAYIEQLKKLLTPGGRLFIAVPNYTSGDAAHYQSYWAAYDVPRHLYHFSPTAMRTLLQQHGLQVEAIQPMWFDSFYVSLLSEKYKTGRTRLLRGGLNGWRSNYKAWRHKERCSSLIYIVRK